MDAILKWLSTRGYKTAPAEFYEKIRTWWDWYKNEVDNFHNTKFYNGIQVVNKDMNMLGMAKTISEAWANLLMNEKVEITTGDDNSDDELKKVFDDNAFLVNANQLIELAFALGTGAFVEYIQDNQLMIDFVSADMIYPLAWNNRGITECAFGSRTHTKEGNCIQLQLHTLQNGKYVIENKLILTEKGMFKELPLPKGLLPKWNTGSETAYFQIVKPNVVNNVDRDCPLGVSIYANAIDILKEIDTTFDAINTEIETGRRMVFMSADMFYTDINGNTRDVIGERESVIRYIGDVENNDHKMVHDYSPTLRVNEMIGALQFQLNLLSEKVGMGTNGIEFNRAGAKTATEIISENSEMYKSMRKHEILLETAIKGLVTAISDIGSKLGINVNAEEVSVNFDDSIIQDTQAIKTQALLEYQHSLIDAVQYYQDVYGLTEDQATEFREKLMERNPQPEQPNPEEMIEGGIE